MILHFNLGTNDLERAEQFYNALLLELFDAEQVIRTRSAIVYTFDGKSSRLAINKTYDGRPATPGNGSMVAMLAQSREHVARVYRRALEMGATSEGEPGCRRKGVIYAAYFRDPDGNKFGIIYPTGVKPSTDDGVDGVEL